jgi:hypothetical protein
MLRWWKVCRCTWEHASRCIIWIYGSKGISSASSRPLIARRLMGVVACQTAKHRSGASTTRATGWPASWREREEVCKSTMTQPSEPTERDIRRAGESAAASGWAGPLWAAGAASAGRGRRHAGDDSRRRALDEDAPRCSGAEIVRSRYALQRACSDGARANILGNYSGTPSRGSNPDLVWVCALQLSHSYGSRATRVSSPFACHERRQERSRRFDAINVSGHVSVIAPLMQSRRIRQHLGSGYLSSYHSCL